MRKSTVLMRTAAAALATVLAAAIPAASQAQPVRVGNLPAGTQRPTSEVLLSIGQGQLVTLPTGIANVWTSNPNVADVYVSNARQIHLFGKDAGEATVFATTANGQVVYATNVRVNQNITSLDKMLKLAFPDADIAVNTAGQLAVLTGTIGSPEDSAAAERLVLTALNPGVNVSEPNAPLKMGVINRLKTATPLQVNLQVRIAEVSRDLVKEIGSNLLTRDQTGGFLFGVAQGRNFGSIGDVDISKFPTVPASTFFPGATGTIPINPATGLPVNPANPGTAFNYDKLGPGAGKTAIAMAGRLFGIDVASALDLAETEGLVTTLANPNLTALSGETASFLAGGEIPIPLAQGLGQIGVEYKQYGVSLAFTPTVLGDGRISMRVRPEVSELSSTGSVTLNGFQIPALTTRRAETTVELGSGQSFMIGGLLQNKHFDQIDKAPGVGDIPILGSLFRSTRFRHSETELVIIITPYLVKPTNGPIPLPTDGYKSATDAARVLMGKTFTGDSGAQRPVPTMAAPQVQPAGQPVSQTTPLLQAPTKSAERKPDAAPAPGFSLK
ncbi:secretion system protein [Sphingomonas sp. MAH-20]|uniref:Secretion system protein n=1 Tax=Sphingomonas horti TaxID=2682842 RepID=A0A6I4J0K0_9SPHN|nr:MULTISPECIES: type II and III secretion system protein family protein [Sphingomonas]MBA2918182.1 type II and III secretion system protein family protein [Sphingomonas sp. CGMCC 1.13658]MVO77151.1 secretion system protein [Sphingomonas horti]